MTLPAPIELSGLQDLTVLPPKNLDLMVQKHLLEEWLRNTRHPEGHILVSLKRLHLREINEQLAAPRRED